MFETFFHWKLIRNWKLEVGNSSGQSLVDILIGMVLLVISINAAIVLVFGGQSALTNRENATQARALAKEGIEAANLILKENWNGSTDGVHGLAFSTSTGEWRLNGSEDSQSIFTRKITISTLNNNEKYVSSTVTWNYNPLQLDSVELDTLVTNWSEIQATGGDTGGNPPTGNWCNPRTLGTIDLGAGVSATDIDVKDKIAYITGTASAQSKPDFFVVDVSDGSHPVIIFSTSTGAGLNAVDVAGNYAYVVGSDNSKELQVIDITSSSSPSVVATLDLPGSADGFSIFYRSNYVYIGRADGAAQEFEIVNISSPLAPTLVSGLANVGNEINRIYVYNNRAYVGTEDVSKGLHVIDVSNPSSPQDIGSFNTGTHIYGIYALNNSRVYLGAKTNFWIVDATVTSSIAAVGSSTVVGSGVKIRDIALDYPYAFIATEDSNKEYQALDISDPKNITVCGTFNFPNLARGIDYENNFVYVAVRSNDALRIITSQ